MNFWIFTQNYSCDDPKNLSIKMSQLWGVWKFISILCYFQEKKIFFFRCIIYGRALTRSNYLPFDNCSIMFTQNDSTYLFQTIHNILQKIFMFIFNKKKNLFSFYLTFKLHMSKHFSEKGMKMWKVIHKN